MCDLANKKILLIIGGSVAAYKSLELIRRLKEHKAEVTTILTQGGEKFITPLAVSALNHRPVYQNLFSSQDEMDIGHIRLARRHDIIVIAPCTASRLAKIANGFADDLASAVILARTSPLLCVPAMNPSMWHNVATQRNVDMLKTDGIKFVGPQLGQMAENGESGLGRMAETSYIINAITEIFSCHNKPLKGRHILVTAGPTYEAIDPVRFIGNRSSGKQGYAIAQSLQEFGAKVTLISGPVSFNKPRDVEVYHVETALQMLRQVEEHLPVDAIICTAAVSDWRAQSIASQKLKKKYETIEFNLKLIQNPDILNIVGHHKLRPKLVIGFAAETQNLIKNAQDKLTQKGADWIVANDVSQYLGRQSVFGSQNNKVVLIRKDEILEWPEMSKVQVASHLTQQIVDFFNPQNN